MPFEIGGTPVRQFVVQAGAAQAVTLRTPSSANWNDNGSERGKALGYLWSRHTQSVFSFKIFGLSGTPERVSVGAYW